MLEKTRPWSIAEQTYEDDSTRFRFEFTSVPAAGAAADGSPGLRLMIYSPGRDKRVTLTFDRDGLCRGSMLEPFGGAVPEPELENPEAQALLRGR